MASIKTPGNPRVTRKQLLIGGAFITLMAVSMMVGMAIQDRDRTQRLASQTTVVKPMRAMPLAESARRDSQMKGPGGGIDDTSVGRAVTDEKIAELKAAMEKNSLDQKNREEKAKRDAELKAQDREKAERAEADTNRAKTANAGKRDEKTGAGFKLFDVTQLGKSLGNRDAGPQVNSGTSGQGQNSDGKGNGTQVGGETPTVPRTRISVTDFNSSGGGAANTNNRNPGAASGGVNIAGAGNTALGTQMKQGIEISAAGLGAMGDAARASGAAMNMANNMAGSSSRVPRNVETYLPSGTWFGVTTLTGMDAPTGGQAQNNPHPILMNVRTMGRLPNMFKADIRNCAVTGQGWGELTSERAYIRTENLSCVRMNGEVIDIPFAGYIVGGDGKIGLRGKVVTKQGQVLSKALWTSMLASLGEVARAASTQVNVVGGTSSTGSAAVSTDTLLRRGALGGIGDAAKQLSQYYIRLAESLYPVIEIDGGQEADVVLSSGTSLMTPGQRGSFSNFASVGQGLRQANSSGFGGR